MNLPFSGLPAATVAHNADLICITQGGVSKKSTRPIFLTAQAGENLLINGAGAGQVIALPSTGEVTVSSQNGQTVVISANSSQLNLSSAGAVLLAMANGQNIFVGSTDVHLLMDDAGKTVVLRSLGSLRLEASALALIIDMTGAAITITYADTSGSWNPNPTDLLAAMTRIAAAVSGLLAGPIP